MANEITVSETDMTDTDPYLPEDFFSLGNLDWILIRSPGPMLTALLLYLLFVLKIGPSYMKTRPAYELTGALRVYNIVQVFLNGFLFFYPIVWHSRSISTSFEFSCATPKYSDEIHKWREAFYFGSWCYICLKFLDLFDTVFMILRKKDSHVSFLHVYHHTTMVFSTWITAKYSCGYQATIPAWMNIFVHTVMYSYYFLATFGPGIKRYLWWKKHLTKLQLTQFAVILLYLLVLYYKGCPIPIVFTYIWIFNVFVILCLFTNFYIQSYTCKENVKSTKKD